MNSIVTWFKLKTGFTRAVMVIGAALITYFQAHPEAVQAIITWLGAHPRTAGLVAPLSLLIALLKNPQVQAVVKEIEGDIKTGV